MPAPLKLNRIITPDGIFGAKMTIFESAGARNPRSGTVLIFPGRRVLLAVGSGEYADCGGVLRRGLPRCNTVI